MLEWTRNSETYIKDNFEPKVLLKNVKVLNNRLLDAKNVPFAYIVSKETNIIAKNITFKLVSTSKPKEFIESNN